MAFGFQSSGFQHPGFQGDTGGAVVIITPPRGGGHRSGIHWPRRGKKREIEVVAAVVAQVLEDVPVARQIDVGLLAHSLIEANSYRALRQIDSHEELIRLIKRELEEWDDEDALLLLL